MTRCGSGSSEICEIALCARFSLPHERSRGTRVAICTLRSMAKGSSRFFAEIAGRRDCEMNVGMRWYGNGMMTRVSDCSYCFVFVSGCSSD